MTSPTRSLSASINARVRKSAFFERTVAAGLSSVSTYNHMWLPTGYGDAEAEYRRITEGVSIWDVSAQRHLAISGPDASRLVAAVTVIDVATVEPGSSAYAPMTDHHGTLVNDPILIRFVDGTWVFSLADADVGILVRSLGHERGLDVSVEERDTVTLAVQGPRSFEVADALGLGVGSLDEGENAPATVGGIDVVLSRSGWSGQDGFELFLGEPMRGPDLWDAVWTAGEPLDIGPACPNQSERLEAGLLSYGTDTGYRADPFEVGLGELVDLDGDDFVGREALAGIAEHGPRRHLLGCTISGDRIDVLEHPVPFDDRRAESDRPCELRTAVWSRRFGTNVGLALVSTDRRSGESFDLDLPSGRRTVDLVEFPFDSLDGDDGSAG